MGFGSVQRLPTKSYTRKNAGLVEFEELHDSAFQCFSQRIQIKHVQNCRYLYAIANGAEWIYDTDDDNKPFGMMNRNVIS